MARNDSWENPALNYTLEACETDGAEICPEKGDETHCPCASGGSSTKCSTLECADEGNDPGGTCGTFVFSTVRFTYTYIYMYLYYYSICFVVILSSLDLVLLAFFCSRVPSAALS